MPTAKKGLIVPEITITATPYGPEPSDGTPVDYLARCGEALLAQYGYDFTILGGVSGGSPVRQLQVTIADENASGGKRCVVITAPEPVMVVAGDVMAESAFNAKYGIS